MDPILNIFARAGVISPEEAAQPEVLLLGFWLFLHLNYKILFLRLLDSLHVPLGNLLLALQVTNKQIVLL